MVEDSFGYSYWLKITDGIEEYIKEQKSDHFKYNNIDFVYAFSRKVYFILVSRTLIKEKIKNAILNKEETLEIALDNKTIRKILELMYKNIQFKFLENKPKIEHIIEQKIVIGDINQEYDYLFIIHQTKFIRYFSHIYEALDSCIFVLVNLSDDAIDLCKSKEYRYITVNYNYLNSSNICWDINGLTQDYDISNLVLDKLNPKKIILPEGNIGIGEVYNLAAQSRRVGTICIQQGWSPVCHIGFRNMHYDKFLLWGDKFKELLQPYNCNQKFIVTGNHNLNSSEDNNTVDKGIGVFLQHYSGSIMFNKKEYDELIVFIYEIAIKYPLKKIIIRKHPGYELEDYIIDKFKNFNNIEYMHSEEYTLNEVLRKISISIAIHSTVLLESLAYNVIPFIFNNTAMPHYEPDISKNGLAVEVSNTTDGLGEITKIINDKEYSAILVENINKNKIKYFFESKENTIKNIIKEIHG